MNESVPPFWEEMSSSPGFTYLCQSRKRKRLEKRKSHDEVYLEKKINLISRKINQLVAQDDSNKPVKNYQKIGLLNGLKSKLESLENEIGRITEEEEKKAKRRRCEVWGQELSPSLIKSDAEAFTYDFKEIAERDDEWNSHTDQMCKAYKFFEEMALEGELDRRKAKRVSNAALKRLPSKEITVYFLIPPDNHYKITKCQLFASNIPFFKSLLTGGFREGYQEGPIKLENITPSVFKNILHYIKKGSLTYLSTYDEQHIVELIHAANMYQISSLVEMGDRTLAKKVTEFNAYTFFKLSYEMAKDYQIYLPTLFEKSRFHMKLIGLECHIKRKNKLRRDRKKELFNFVHAPKIEFQLSPNFFKNSNNFEDFKDIGGLEETHLSLEEAGSSVVTQKNFELLNKMFPSIQEITLPITKGAVVRHWDLLKGFSKLKKIILDLDYINCDYDTLFYALKESCLPKVANEQNYQVIIMGLNQCMELTFSQFKLFRPLFKNWDPFSRHLGDNLRNITDEQLKKLAKTSGEIESLDLSGFSQMTDKGAISIIHYRPNLRRLDLSRSKHLTDETLFYIAKSLPKLKHIRLCYLKNFTEKGLVELFKNCKELETISLNQCSGVTDQVVIQLSETCKNLKNLDLSRFIPSPSALNKSDISEVGDSSICMLVKECKFLKYLNLIGHTKLNSSSIEAIAEYGLELKRLNLWGCININGAVLPKLAKLKKLKVLDINYLDDVQPADIFLLVDSLPALNDLSFKKPFLSSLPKTENKSFLIKTAYEQNISQDLISRLRIIM